jgi:hypothetical protein
MNAGNQGQPYRLPWTWTAYNRGGYGPSEGLSGHGPGAMDFDLSMGESVKAIGEGQVLEFDTLTYLTTGLGAFVKMVHIITGGGWNGRSGGSLYVDPGFGPDGV